MFSSGKWHRMLQSFIGSAAFYSRAENFTCWLGSGPEHSEGRGGSPRLPQGQELISGHSKVSVGVIREK